MTKEEAKNVLYEWQEMMVRNGVPIDTSKVQALRVAIEALSERTGEWIGYNADKGDSWLRTDGTPIFLVCDKCNATVLSNGSAHWNFCPNCGAKMFREDGEA